MSPSRPTVQLNTFVQSTRKPSLDFLTKIIVIAELAVGLNRSVLFGDKNKFFTAALIYAIVLNCTIVYNLLYSGNNFYVALFRLGAVLQHIIEISLAVGSCKRMKLYYIELNRFDQFYGHNTKFMCVSLRKVLIFTVICFSVILMMLIPNYSNMSVSNKLALVPLHMTRVMELFYYGHLHDLLKLRLREVNRCVKLSLLTSVDEVIVMKMPNKHNMNLKKQMKLYDIIANAHDELNRALKWQFLVMIIMSFIFTLIMSFEISLSFVKDYKSSFHLVVCGGLAIIEFVTLFAPCVYGDNLHSEVKQLRELLAIRLYDNKLDKQSRSTARALLYLTENRNLSFSLLRTLNIDTSFPFKLVELVVMYLIVFLQFEKVFNA